jgi:hypothetical protein
VAERSIPLGCQTWDLFVNDKPAALDGYDDPWIE